jgi:hypothetical protein
MEPHKIPEHMGRKSRTGSSPTSSFTRSAHPCSASPSGTVAPSSTAPDVMFSIAANAPVRLGIGIGEDSVTSKPSTTFPYVPAVQAEEHLHRRTSDGPWQLD